MTLYKGFSTKNFVQGGGSLRVYDIECVKDDLYRHIHTVYGERVYMPGFGTNIPTTPFEPNDPTTIESIRADIASVVEYDPRVSLINLQLYSLPNENSIVAMCDLLYVEFNVNDQLRLDLKI
jgi:phage baseplate assembly protein W